MQSFKDAVTSSAASTSSDATLLTGRVKWFNSKAGYGFITVTDGERSGSDIFAHHSSIQVSNQQYKYLVQGEYVQFTLTNTPTEKHECQASNISGINSGQLMCETRHAFKVAKTAYKSSTLNSSKNETDESSSREGVAPVKKQSQPVVKTAEGKQTSRVRGEGPRDAEKKSWTLVEGNNTKKQTKPRGRPPRQATN
jgi:CspA family cold shock protein